MKKETSKPFAPFYQNSWRFLFLLGLFFGISCASQPKDVVLIRSRLLMGHVPVQINLKIQAREKERALADSEETFALAKKIEGEISEYQPSSEISCLNLHAGKSYCKLGPNTMDLLLVSRRLSELTENFFDLRFASPTSAGRKGKILIREKTFQAKLVHPDTILGVGAIGKGWIVDRMIDFLKSRGYSQILINAGGDLRAVGGPWKIGIQIPNGKPGSFIKPQTIFNEAWATSGQYEQPNHVMDPHSGKAVSIRKSVTVRADSLTLADALATAFLVMGEQKSASEIKKFPGIEIFWTDPEGTVRNYFSPKQ